MNLIIDANILFAALIRGNITAELIIDEKVSLFAPEFLLEEFQKYKELILNKTSRTEKEFEEILSIFLSLIRIIPISQFNLCLEEAENISPDKKDAAYFALALKLKCPIWSNDKLLKNQNIVKVYSTEDLLRII